MLVNADIYVKDIPGQLVSALEPMSTVNANIIGVVHSREQMVSGRIAVNLTFDIDPDMIDRLKEIWKSNDVIVAKIGSAIDLRNIVFMIIGDLTAATADELVAGAKDVAEIQSKDIRVSSNSSGRNTCMVSINVKTEEEITALDRYFSERCRSKGYTYIRGVE
ncbi:MAG: hypothetical protein PUK31_03125 [Candidatus Methanomethylophilaceae archaeon]|nr:hypothetical protein [Candidatus Methanomethylophilaceae archaeon]MDY5872594.1 hypothetical protein [Candidatus Methanomethylophilaceae archaeon]